MSQGMVGVLSLSLGSSVCLTGEDLLLWACSCTWFLVLGSAPSVQLCPYLVFFVPHCEKENGDKKEETERVVWWLVVEKRDTDRQKTRRDNTKYTGRAELILTFIQLQLEHRWK